MLNPCNKAPDAGTLNLASLAGNEPSFVGDAGSIFSKDGLNISKDRYNVRTEAELLETARESASVYSRTA